MEPTDLNRLRDEAITAFTAFLDEALAQAANRTVPAPDAEPPGVAHRQDGDGLPGTAHGSTCTTAEAPVTGRP